MRSCPDYAGCALRWPLLHGRSHDGRILPADLSRAAGAIKERVLLPLSGGCRGRWLSAMPPLPSRDRPILAGMERDRTTVARGLRLIARGALDGKGSRSGHLPPNSGLASAISCVCSPSIWGLVLVKSRGQREYKRAKRMLDTTDMPMSQIPLAARFRQLASVQYGVLRNLWSAVNRFASQVIRCRSMREPYLSGVNTARWTNRERGQRPQFTSDNCCFDLLPPGAVSVASAVVGRAGVKLCPEKGANVQGSASLPAFSDFHTIK